MAKPVLTSVDKLICSHGGQITLLVPPTRSLKAAGNPVLTQSDLTTAIIACPSQVPCVKVTSTLAGASQVLQADGAAVLLAGAQGATNAGTWNAATPGTPALEA